MGRLDLRPARVRHTVSMLLAANRQMPAPAWYEAMGNVPPPEILSRTLPVQHQPPPVTGRRKVRKASKVFMPQRITYEEDDLRKDFFTDHPWELARPRLMVEIDGKDNQRWDWSKPFEAGRPINGESVVRRQQYLMNKMMEKATAELDEKRRLKHESKPREEPHANQRQSGSEIAAVTEAATEVAHEARYRGYQEARNDAAERAAELTRAREIVRCKAYDQARKEFYDFRHEMDVERRVAHEEALAVSAQFGPSRQDIGMRLEKKWFDKWRAWAEEQADLADLSRSAAFGGPGRGAATLVEDMEKTVQEGAKDSTAASADSASS